jgi:hypothetical protein
VTRAPAGGSLRAEVGAAAAARPVLLATLGVPFARDAAAFAVESALEAGVPLVVVNAVQLPPLPLSVVMGFDQAAEPQELVEELLYPVRLASSLGVHVERIRVRSPRPVEALLELLAEREPGLLVFGPEHARLGRRRYERARRRILERAPCLVWAAGG